MQMRFQTYMNLLLLLKRKFNLEKKVHHQDKILLVVALVVVSVVVVVVVVDVVVVDVVVVVVVDVVDVVDSVVVVAMNQNLEFQKKH